MNNGENEENLFQPPLGRDVMIQQNDNMPRRRLSLTQNIHCRFYNTTGRNVDVIWVPEYGFSQKYSTLKYRQYETIASYEGHFWSFYDAFDGEQLISSDGNFKYIVSKDRLHVFIRVNPKNLSLIKFCFRRILNNEIFKKDLSKFIQSLELPKILEYEMAKYLICCIQYQSKYSMEMWKIASQKFTELSNFLNINSSLKPKIEEVLL